MKKPATYEVTLRRDVQQVTCIRVQASASSEAIAVAESISDDDSAWNTEKYLGAHRPKVLRLRDIPIKGRAPGKVDRRTATDRRADKRRLDDKSRALVTGRRSRAR